MTEGGRAGDPLAPAIAARARRSGIELRPAAAQQLASHARLVIARNDLLHLTTIVSPDDLVERHIGEAFEGAALLPRGVSGMLVDLGSGNGYPGIPLAIARPGLLPVLAESNRRKAEFLREALAASGLSRGRVLATSVQRPTDLSGCDAIAVLASRAMGGWERIVPKLVPALAPDARVLLWTGAELPTVLRRAAWRRLELESEQVLPGKSTSRVACLRLAKL